MDSEELKIGLAQAAPEFLDRARTLRKGETWVKLPVAHLRLMG